jgi:hypothetical protein
MKAAKITIMHKIVYNGTMIPYIYVGLNNTHNFGGKKLLVKNSIIACDAKKIRRGILFVFTSSKRQFTDPSRELLKKTATNG